MWVKIAQVNSGRKVLIGNSFQVIWIDGKFIHPHHRVGGGQIGEKTQDLRFFTGSIGVV